MRGRLARDAAVGFEESGAAPALGVRLDPLVGAVRQKPCFEAHLAPPRVQQPELGDSGLRVLDGQAFRVLGLRAVADDLDHEIGRSFELHEAAGRRLCRRDLPDAAGIQRGEQSDDDVRLRREIAGGGCHPGAVDEDVTALRPGDQQEQLGRERGLQGAVGLEVLRAHVDVDLTGEVVDPAGLREAVGPSPGAKSGQAASRPRDARTAVVYDVHVSKDSTREGF